MAAGRSRARWLLALACALPAGAGAQTYGPLLGSEIPLTTQTGRMLGVADRPHPELDAPGVTAGSFLVRPELDLGIGYTSNVIGTEQDRRGDGFLGFSPHLRAISRWSRHSLIAAVDYDGRRYLATPQKNEDGFAAQLDGRIDMQADGHIDAALSRRRVFEQQTAGAFPANGAGAVAVDQSNAGLRVTQVFNRLRLIASGDANRFDYADTVSTTGARLDQDFRDNRVYRAGGRVEYLLTPDNAVFGQVGWRHTDYAATRAGLDRTSTEWRLIGGAIADVTGLLRLAGGAGYFHRRYDDPGFGTIAGLAVDLRADYYVTALSTVSAIASRKVEEATVPRSPGYVATRFGAQVDHELLRNLILHLSADRERDRFVRIDRHDRFVRIAAAADYTLRPELLLRPGLEYVDRSSRGVDRGPSIAEFRALLTLVMRR